MSSIYVLGEREAVSLQPSLLEQANIGMRKSHSLLAMYVLAAGEADLRPWLVLRNKQPVTV